MHVTPISTRVIRPGDSLTGILDEYLNRLSEGTIVAVTSKIIALTENRTAPIGSKAAKKKLIALEADLYLDDPLFDKYGIILTVKNGHLAVSAGIDESNGNGRYILWPENPMLSAAFIWQHLRKSNRIKRLGVVITDSRSSPLSWGVTGYAIGWSGIEPLRSYIGKPDIFGRPFKFVNTSIIDSAAASAVAVMGEGAEKKPLAVIRDMPDIRYTNRPPDARQIRAVTIPIEDDLYAPLLRSVSWKKGGVSQSDIIPQ